MISPNGGRPFGGSLGQTIPDIRMTHHLGFPHKYVGPIYTSSCRNYLHTTTKDPLTQSNLLYMERWSRVCRDPSLYKEIPMYQGIRVSSLLLYKPQTLPFLRYVNSPYLLHSWILGDFSIIDLTFRGSLASTPLVPFNWFFSFVLQVPPLARVWTINSRTIFVHH